MRILVISGNYPSSYAPQKGVFVYNLIQEFVHQGNEVYVISPEKRSLLPRKNFNYGEEKAILIRPNFFSFSNKQVGPFNTFKVTRFFTSMSIRKAVMSIDHTPDVIYCHFIISALNYFQAFPSSEIPVYIAVGEYHNIDVIRKYFDQEYYFDFLKKIKGFIAVSPQIRDKLLELGVDNKNIIVEPNAVDLGKFKPGDKEELRLKYGLPLDKKLILFVGRFLENKGPLRVQRALDYLGDDVAAIFVGKGGQQIDHEKILFSGLVEHDTVADYMALADVFVLPTLHEGSSNVIVEAMASGLPIVSSNIPEIRVQCNPDYSILVDPMDVEAIASALKKIISNSNLQESMSQRALEVSYRFDIKKRSERILEFMMTD